METFSALLAICAGNSPLTGEFPAQRPATQSFDVFFDLRLKKNGWVNNGEAGDLRRHHTHYDVTVMHWTRHANTQYQLMQQPGRLLEAEHTLTQECHSDATGCATGYHCDTTDGISIDGNFVNIDIYDTVY